MGIPTSRIPGLSVSGQPVVLPSYTTVARDALTPDVGWTIYNTTANVVQIYDGTEWRSLQYATIFVDSVAGDDAFDGLSPTTAFQTLDRASQDLKAGQFVMLKAGSLFREELANWPAGVYIRTYGGGDRPIIDAREIADNSDFSATVGQTNVYEISWSHDFDFDGGKSAHRVWENNVMMTRAANLAACDSTPGSFYAVAPTAGGPDLVYIHPAGSTDPTTNGRTYSLTKRRWAIQLYTSYKQANVTGLEAIGNSYADGSLCIDGYVEDCVARDGRVHNAFILGEAYNCKAYATEAGVNSTMFVTYKDASSFGPDGRNTLFRNCLADAQATMTGVSGFYMHTDNVHFFGTIEYRDCRVVGCDAGWGGIQAAKVVTYRCTYEDVINAFGFVATDNYILGGTGHARGGFFDGGLIYVNTGAPVTYTVHGCKELQTSGFGPTFIYLTGGTCSIQRCTFTTDIGGIVRLFRGNVTFKRNVVAYGNVNCTQLHYFTDPIDFYDADYNCYWNPANMDGAFQALYPTPTNYNTLASWQTYLIGEALGPGTEANSIAQDPDIPGYLDLDFTIENATVLSMGIGAEVNEEDDPELQAYWLANRVTEV